MARRTRRGFYAVRARHHEAAAKKAKGSDKEGHKMVAHGYHKLARGAHAMTARKHKRRRSHRRSKRKGRRF